MKMKRLGWLTFLLLAWTRLVTPSARAQNYEILHQDLDASRHGYTVLRVWGSHHDMGHAMGSAFANDIESAWTEIKAQVGAYYGAARSLIAATTWLPGEIEDELDGVLEGVQSVVSTQMDVIDLKLLNAFSDLLYGACRSHACWGSYVQEPVKSLATRRLDFGTPFDVALHHVLCAWDPDDGSARWVNLAWPGYVTVITGVNEFGTLVSLHDYNSDASWGANRAPRSVATRLVLTGVPDSPVQDHLAWAEQALSDVNVVTGTFLNYYAPQGYGGVFTCVSGGLCGAPRTPQSAYRNGEVLITTNSQTDGTSVPSGGSFMDDYYESGGPKDLQSHFGLMGTTGLHLLSVEYRGRGDMTIWINGRPRTDRVEVEWSELFPDDHPDGGPSDGGPQDAGPADAGPSDAGSPDAGPEDAGFPDAGVTDAGTDAGADAGAGDPGTGTDEDNPPADSGAGTDQDRPGEGNGGCGCASGGGGCSWMLLVLVPWTRRRRGKVARST